MKNFEEGERLADFILEGKMVPEPPLSDVKGVVDRQADDAVAGREEPLLPAALQERRRHPGDAGEDRGGVDRGPRSRCRPK